MMTRWLRIRRRAVVLSPWKGRACPHHMRGERKTESDVHASWRGCLPRVDDLDEHFLMSMSIRGYHFHRVDLDRAACWRMPDGVLQETIQHAAHLARVH